VFPTGQRIDVIDGTELTCIDAAMPLMIDPRARPRRERA
jgi:2-methylaconitate cis-trans-isomerase PrpF